MSVSKHSVVMSKVPELTSEKAVMFANEKNEDTGKRTEIFMMPIDLFVEMDTPDFITVTVVPGDQLQDE